MPAASKIRSVNPATFEVLGEVAVSTPEQIKEAVAAARKAQPAWQALGVAGRIEALKKLYEDITNHRDELAAIVTREMGRPIEASVKAVYGPLNVFRWNLDNALTALAPETTHEDVHSLHQMHYEPYGVFGVIAPWNFPVSNFVMTALQPLLAGNTVVYKLAEEVPLFGKALDECFARAKVPTGVFGQVYGGGAVGEALAWADIDHLHFTGSTAVGKKLYQVAAERFIPVTLELGGSDAGLVFEDADLDRIIEPLFWARFVNSGQRCCALKRLFVHEDRYGELVKKLTAFIQKQKIGDPLEKDTVFGPLASARHRDLLAAQVEDAKQKGVKVLLGGAAPPGPGAYFEPTLLTGVTAKMRVANEELFGPVLPIATFSSEEQAIRLANATPFGLSAFVYTEDRARFRRVAAQLEAGEIAHNTVDYWQPFNPHGGFKYSGFGKSGGKAGLRGCCRIKVVSMEK